MKQLLLKTVFLFISICFTACNSGSEKSKDKLTVFTNVNIIPLDREVILEDQMLIVQNGKILTIKAFSKKEIPTGSTVIDCEEKYLIPGLSDMHTHLEGDAWNIIYPPELKYTEEELSFEDILFIYLANGVTTIYVMSAFPEHIQIRDSIKNKLLLGPELILSRMIDGLGMAWPPPVSTWVANPEEAKKAVYDAKELGYDRIKVYSFLDEPSYDAIMDAAKELDMKVDGHIPVASSVEHVTGSGQSMIAHSEEFFNFARDFSKEEITRLCSILIENGIWLNATITTSRNLAKLFANPNKELHKPETEILHPQSKGTWEYIYENLYKPIPEENREFIKSAIDGFQVPFVYEFHSSGGKLLSGTDALIPPTLPGISIHDELQEFVNSGISNYETLKISCVNSQEFLDRADERGTLEVGKLADFVLLNSNPLDDISASRDIAGVFTKNTWISDKEIKERLELLKQSYSDLMLLKNQ